jgi:hypothetical protein
MWLGTSIGNFVLSSHFSSKAVKIIIKIYRWLFYIIAEVGCFGNLLKGILDDFVEWVSHWMKRVVINKGILFLGWLLFETLIIIHH